MSSVICINNRLMLGDKVLAKIYTLFIFRQTPIAKSIFRIIY